ncbi:neutral and basic amino acid transport protein rBAT [Hylaeus anthracinus]|uniref:neutral and basic amino acid transport protein rBAT n=1 Tax=Hylaeus anthracinus TaxID=313031 RepID=UPI0023B8DF43|nr:neutral and basic amino acid transport protein rBAT [Hylaeus anthracinus]
MESGRLDLESVEANGIAKETAVVATYKTLPDDDVNRQPSTENNVMGKPNNENEVDDGVHEKMLKEESKVSPTKEATDMIKFISENGDAKIDIETVKQALSGMGKEELMKFANDPFWVKLRWFLFITFWLIWLAMLAGAIAIVAMAPKCSAPKPKEWWETSPIVQLDPAETGSHNLREMGSLLDTLKEQNVDAISLASVIKESATGGVEDFTDIKPQLGTISDLEAVIEAAKYKKQYIILELDPVHTSTEHSWFKQSIERKDPFTSYYVWADGKTADGRRSPPNNWLSLYGGSAWEWNEQRGQYYLHHFNKTQPKLNYNNPAVIAEFADVLKHWLKIGVSGFRLANTQYLTEDPQLHDEFRSTIPTEADNYDSLVHAYTRGRPENAAVLSTWQETVYNETTNTGLFTLQDDIGTDILQVYNEKKKLIDIPQSSQFLITANSSINATTLHKGFSQWLNFTSWPAWDLNGKKSSLRQRMPGDIADSLTLMTLLLPGTPVLKLNDTLSAKEAFATLAKSRHSSTFLYGETSFKTVNGSVFVYTRLKSGNPGYLVAYQTAEEPTVVDLSMIPQISEEVSVVAHSPNYVQDGDTIRTKLPSNKVPISAKSTVVLTFVPKN